MAGSRKPERAGQTPAQLIEPARAAGNSAGPVQAAMLIDTHCHLDAPEFEPDRNRVIARAHEAGLAAIVVPAVAPSNLDTVRRLTEQHPQLVYALGIHPLFTKGLSPDWLAQLRRAVRAARDDPRLVAIGEIGLDFFVKDLDPVVQETVYRAQLELAAEFGLPVLLHVRRSQDRLLKYLRQIPVCGGIAHAFNGSSQQARQFLERGFALGFGGAMTFERARQIRRLAADLPDTAHVLETDAPDMAPEWINRQRNEPAHLPRIAANFAQLRQSSLETVFANTERNARRVIPKLALHLDQTSAPSG